MRNFLKKQMLWIAMIAVLIPLGVMLSLQYTWLVRLHETSALAKKAQLDTYLAAVTKEIESFYYRQAWSTLQVPVEMLAGDVQARTKYHFRKTDVKGAKYLFIVSYQTGDDYSVVHFYDPATQTLTEEPPLPTVRATMVALAPWKMMVAAGSAPQSIEMTSDERDTDNRIILQPIVDEQQLIGVAGMVLDGRFFEHDLLPYAIKQSLPDFFEHSDREDLVLTVRDGKGRYAFSTAHRAEGAEEASTSIPFVFKDWRVGLASRFVTPEQLARSNFTLNISMSILLAIFLVGGIWLVLRAASRAMKFSEMKSDFVSNVSHELRTPLASIRVFGEFLRLGRVRDEKKIAEYGEYIETQSSRLTQLINNILDFSKIECGAKTYELEPTDLTHVLTESLRPLQVSLKHQGFGLTYELPEQPLPEMDLDPDAIGQAVANLVDNAVKYSGTSTAVHVEVARQEDAVTISVVDRGIGISRDEQKKIFDRFHRVSTGLVHDVKGSGLGLSIVSHIVGAHGGTITVESEEGRGSAFCVRLPIRHSVSQESSGFVPAPDAAQNVGKS